MIHLVKGAADDETDDTDDEGASRDMLDRLPLEVLREPEASAQAAGHSEARPASRRGVLDVRASGAVGHISRDRRSARMAAVAGIAIPMFSWN